MQTQSFRRPADRVRLTNIELAKDELVNLPDDFYGVLEFHFVRGAIMHLKSITSKKFNPEAKTPEAHDGQFSK